MKELIQAMTKGLVGTGVACLLLGGLLQTPQATASMGSGTISCALAASGHHENYGNWSYASATWYAANTRDFWAATTVPFSLPYGWTAWVLYDLTYGGLDEVAFVYDVAGVI